MNDRYLRSGSLDGALKNLGLDGTGGDYTVLSPNDEVYDLIVNSFEGGGGTYSFTTDFSEKLTAHF